MTAVDLALLILRLAVGLTFAAHGAQKAFGWWGGPGPANWLRAVHAMGFHPPALFAAASIEVELVAGVALALGFLTPVAAAVVVGQAVVIIVQVHLPHGFFSKQGGMEFPLVLGAAAMAVGLMSAGSVSVDGLLGLGYAPEIRALLAIIGIAVGLGVLGLRGLGSPVRHPLHGSR